ncbi:NB-ARC domain-containing protein [Pseudofrankia sp. BMG5.36]|uniref:NB-ARC domain-containing protein n=1 Tax=Pseudofrankia sp. BMG5.36 TaxID=1834512 RepID=UPI000B0B187F|nr:NB-ARC domain-containing protein [Pseudofrankia sp. BMG5.36]
MIALSDREIDALAHACPDPAAVKELLAGAGFPLDRLPSWNVSTATQLWRAVSEQLAAGVLADGRARVLAAAAARWPYNAVFGSAPARLARLVPSWVDLRSARPLPEQYVPREADLAAVRALLDVDGAGAVGLVGMGGAGKSTIARALIHDEEICRRFTGGAVWVEVNPGADVTAVQGRVLRAFGDARAVVDATDGRERLRDLLSGAHCLVVLDDVWESAVVEAFPRLTGARILVTSRRPGVLHTATLWHPVGHVDPATARDLLASYARWPAADLPPAADTVLAHCGGLPLAVAIAGGLVSGLWWDWDELADLFGGADLPALAVRFPDYPEASLLVAMDTTARLLSTPTAARFRELAVFKGHGPVPVSVIAALWAASAGVETTQARQTLRELANVSFIQINPRSRAVSVHDLVYDYARSSLTHQALADLHAVVGHVFLDRWGGLDHSLPHLRDTTAFTDLDYYGIAELVSHLLAADRPDLVDDLLATEWLNLAGTVHNTWCTTHEDLDRVSDYLATLRAAWHDAKTRYQVNDPNGLVRQIAYALLTGSLASQAGNIPPSLLARLVEADIWTPNRALTYAQTKPDPEGRANALANLAPHLPDDLLAQALATATAIDHGRARVEALAGLAPHLPDEQRSPVLTQALAAATTIGNVLAQALALALLAPQLTEKQRAEALAPALTAAFREQDSARTDLALEALAPHLPSVLLAEALTIVRAIDDPTRRIENLARLAPYMADERGSSITQALAEGMTIDHPGGRARVFLALAPHVTDGKQRGVVLGQALTAIADVGSSHLRAMLLADLAPYLPDSLLAQANAVADALDGRLDLMLAHAALAARRPDRQRGPAMADALTAAAALERWFDRDEVLRVLIPHLPDDLLDQALVVATTVDSPRSRVLALVKLAQHLDDNLLAQMLTTATAIDDPGDKATALAELAPCIADDERALVLDQALAAALAVHHPRDRAAALAALAPHLPERRLAPHLTEALTAVATLDNSDGQAWAFSVLIPHLVEEQRGPVITAALSAVATSDHFWLQADVLRRLALYLPDSLLGQALSVAVGIDDPGCAAVALAGLVVRLPVDQRETAMAQAMAVDANRDYLNRRTKVLTTLAPHLTDRLLDQALAVAATIDDPGDRAVALAGLAPCLPDDQRGTVITQALEAAASHRRSDVVDILPSILSSVSDRALGAATATWLFRVQNWWP